MRKIVFIIIALFAISQNICAQGMTATLQSGDNLKVFYGIDAFKEAYEAAKDGDQITLSAGTFNSSNESISKSVKITGTGAFGVSNTTFSGAFTVTGKDVRIEGLYLGNKFDVSGSTNLYVTRCWLGQFEANSNYTGAVFNESVLRSVYGIQYAQGYTFKNCTIQSFNAGESVTIPKTNFGNIINCVIYSFYTQPYAIYKNNAIGYDFREMLNNYPWWKQATLYCQYPSEYYYNRFFSTTDFSVSISYGSCLNEGNGSCDSMDTDAYPAKNSTKNGALPDGNDGTPVGIYGGSGFSPNPAIPRILNKSVDAYTNDEGKINVKIEVKAEQ